MKRKYDYEKKPSQSTASVQPKATYLHTRGFAPLQTDLDEDATFRPSGYTENFLEKIINQRGTESADTPVQAKPMNRLKAFQSKRMAIQAKLSIGEPNDKYEQEADATASKVVQQINLPAQDKSVQKQESIEDDELQMKPISSIQREESMEDDELQMKSLVQRRENLNGGEASTNLESSIQSARGSGQPLDPNLQDKMGQAMGADFSSVKIHTDSQADQLNRSIQAKAFTTGQDVFFRQGAYNPSSTSGQELIAHELTHTIQQGASRKQSDIAPKAEETSGNNSSANLSIQRKICDARVTQNAHLRDRNNTKKQIGNKLKKGDLIKIDDEVEVDIQEGKSQSTFVKASVLDEKGKVKDNGIGLIRKASFEIYALSDVSDDLKGQIDKNLEQFDKESLEDDKDKHGEKVRKRENAKLKRDIAKNPSLDEDSKETIYSRTKKYTEEGQVAQYNKHLHKVLKKHGKLEQYDKLKKLTKEEQRKAKNKKLKENLKQKVADGDLNKEEAEKVYAIQKDYNEQGQEILDIQERKFSNKEKRKSIKQSIIDEGTFKDIEDEKEREEAIDRAVKREYYSKYKVYSHDDEEKNTEKREKAATKYKLKDEKKKKEKEEEERKEYNAELKKGYREPMSLFAVKKEYYDNKILSDKDKQKKKRNDYNEKLKQDLINKFSSLDLPTKIRDLEYAENALYPPGEKGRKQRNEAIKKLVDEKIYYQEKKLLKPSKGFEFKEHTATTDITSIIGGLNKTASTSSMGSLQIGKRTGNTKVSGVTDKVKDLTTGKTEDRKDITGSSIMKEYGEAAQAQMITSSLGDLIGITNSSVGLANAVERRKSDDPAEKEIASGQIVDSSFDLASNIVSGASDIAKTVRTFAGGTSEIGQNVTSALPIIGIVGNAVDLVLAGKKMVEASHRARVTLKLVKDAKENKDLKVQLSLQNLRNEDLKLVTSATVDVVLYSLQITGQALTLSGMGATVGMPLLYAAKIAAGAKKAAQIIYGEVYARSVQNARNKYEDTRKNDKSNTTELFFSAKELLEKDTKQAAQTIISQARSPWKTDQLSDKFTSKPDPEKLKQSQPAIEYLALFGINEGNLRDPNMKDKTLRELIFYKIEQEEDPQTVRQKVSGMIGKVKDLKNLKYKIRKGVASL